MTDSIYSLYNVQCVLSKRSNYENDILARLFPNFSWELFKIHIVVVNFLGE